MVASSDTNRRTVIRTLASIGTLGIACALGSSVSATAESESNQPGCSSHENRPAPSGHPPEARAQALANHPDRYLAVADRIVDGRHAVLLLEDGDELVGQLVVSPNDLPDVAESDVLLVTLTDDDELESARRLDGETERRKQELEDRFDSLAE